MTSTHTMYEGEIYTRADVSGDLISVRVLFTAEPIHSLHDSDRAPVPLYTDIRILGIFRLDTDAEVDFTLLHNNDQQKIEVKCENEYNKNMA